ncbi:MAG TPA: serine/threonine-protein kinase [Polyangia bacterium]|nr:serine/threonine-protein kinase [Polyangia bacterium]
MSDDRKKLDSLAASATEPGQLPPPPGGLSRVEDLPDSFIQLLSRRPHNVGDIIGNRYKLVERLGEGGMGQVFVAENQAIRSRVAIKLLKSELLTDVSFRKRFQQEAEAIASIDHRNVVRFFDVVVGDPTFLVMEYVAGATLAHVLKKEKRLDPMRACRIGVRLAWALEAVHRSGVVHRDIKPANVVLAADLEGGEEPKLLDFGLVKRHGEAPEEQLTRTGQVVGTPLYMSPEQIAGKDVDARSDVYSLGCLLYHLLSGAPPFEGEDVQVLYKHLQEPPPEIAIADGMAPIPRALLEVVTCALAKRKEQRLQSAAEMAEALAAILPSASKQPLRRRGLSRRAVVTTVALAIPLALALGFVAARVSKKPAAPVAGGGLLILTTTPEGATVELDGHTLPQTTPTVVHDLAAGKHALRIRHHDLALVERQISLERNERQLVDVVLPPSSHRLEVQSTPRGATIYLDDSLMSGETPTTIDVSDNDFHQLRLEKDGFESVTQSLPPDDSRRQLTVELPKVQGSHGLLLVDGDKSAEVWIDGRDTGFATPTIGIRVVAGPHEVEVRDAGDGRAKSKVDVAQGQTVRLTLTPSAPDKKHASH